MRKYRLVAKKGEGTFSEVLKAQNVKDGKYYAIKCMKNRFDSIDQVNNLREIQALRRLSPNQHVITLEEVLYDQPTGRLALVFELMDANLYELIRGRRHYLNGQLVRSYMYQLLKALDHMHRKGIFHRDIKPENILIESTNDLGRGLKLADFGSCRGIYSKQPYTEYISTRWYRAPECLLTDGYYGPEMDQWGAGCVFFEITSLYPLFPGTNELDQIGRVHKVLGNPSGEVLGKFKQNGAAHVDFDFATQKGIGVAQLIPHASTECVDLITKLLRYDWSDRCTARESLRHPYFREIREVDLRKAQAESTSKLARGTTEDAVGGGDSATVASAGRAPQMTTGAAGGGGGGGGGANHGTGAGGGAGGGGGGGGRYRGQTVGQGGSKVSSKKKKKNRGYHDSNIRSKYNGMSNGGGGGGGGGNGFGGAKGHGITSRSSFSLMQAAGGGGGAMGSNIGYGGNGGAGGGNGVPGVLAAQAPERARVGKNTSRYRQLR
ncbi:unnamed protein product [Ectocarpus sp. 12 AP-2014]